MDGSRSYLPAEWSDANRMAVLFKPLPPTDQATARTGRLRFWTTAIHAWTAATNTFTFTLQAVQDAFQRDTLVPQCLQHVLQHMMAEGRVCPAASLNSGETDTRGRESWGQWGGRVLMSSPSWAWAKIKPVAALGQHEQLLDTKLVQGRSHQMYDDYWRNTNLRNSDPSVCRTLTALYHEVTATATPVMGCDGLEVCVRWLTKAGRASLVHHTDGVVYVRLAQPGRSSAAPITDTDIVEVCLASAISQLQQRIDRLTEESSDLRTRAKQAVAVGNRIEAMSLLRRRRRLQSTVAAQLAALENASATHTQLQDAAMNREVITAFRSSAEALKQLMSGAASADGAASAMDQLQQMLEECSDVSAALSGPAITDLPDSEDLERELDSLLVADMSGAQEAGAPQVLGEHDTAARELGEDQQQLVAALQGLHIPEHDPSSPDSAQRHKQKVALTSD